MLCGGVSALIKAGFDTLVKAGYQPELASSPTRPAPLQSEMLKEIQHGTFAKNRLAENEKGRPNFNATRAAERHGSSKWWVPGCAG